MSKGLYVKSVTCGRYGKITKYSRPLPGDGKVVRIKKQAATAAAQRFINIKNSTERLEMLLCGNFDSKAAHYCTMTFCNAHLPGSRKGVGKLVAAYIRKLRQDWKRRGREDLKYLYTIEGEALSSSPSAEPVAGDRWEVAPWRDKERWELLGTPAAPQPQGKPKRFHVHFFLLLRNKADIEAAKALWEHGQVHTSAMRVSDPQTFQRLASYVMKEKRDDEKPNGARGYVPSRNLAQPVVTGHWIEDYEDIKEPDDAECVLHRSESVEDYYGSCVKCISYRLRRPQQIPEPYISKRQKKRTRYSTN